MTLRELIQSVDTEQYSDNTLFQKLRETKPEYGSSRHIVVKLLNGEVAVTNAHVGSLGDILTYPIDVAPDLQVTKIQLLDFILNEIAFDGYTEGEQSESWDEMTNLPNEMEYYGEHSFQMQYKDTNGEPFDWLYIDADTLREQASKNGYAVEVVAEGEHYDYLARITKK